MENQPPTSSTPPSDSSNVPVSPSQPIPATPANSTTVVSPAIPSSAPQSETPSPTSPNPANVAPPAQPASPVVPPTSGSKKMSGSLVFLSLFIVVIIILVGVFLYQSNYAKTFIAQKKSTASAPTAAPTTAVAEDALDVATKEIDTLMYALESDEKDVDISARDALNFKK